MMRSSDPLLKAWKQAVKETVWQFNRHARGPKPDIALFATRRGGSTWLMETLAVNRGVRYTDQPFAVRSASPGQLAHLPVLEDGQFVTLDPDKEEQLHAYITMILDGSLSVNSPWEIWRPVFDFRSNRVVLKIVEAKAIIDWIDRHFDVHVVYMTRHPIPTALSIIRNEWHLTSVPYLRNEAFAEKYLHAHQHAYCWDVHRDGTLLQRHVLNWALENLAPLRLLHDRPHWTHVTFEEAALYPDRVVEHLAVRLGLPDADRMHRQVQRPSRSTKKPRSMISEVEHTHDLIRRWTEYVSDEEMNGCFDVLEALDLTLYRRGSVLPARAGIVPEAASGAPTS